MGVGPPKTQDGGSSDGVDWSKYGLNSANPSDQRRNSELLNAAGGDDNVFLDGGAQNELYRESQDPQVRPWWKANFFISERVLFGTWDGVFTSCMINLFGVIILLRAGWIVGNAGIGQAVLIVLITVVLSSIAVLSGIAICERCKVESGGIHYLLSHVLGARVGGSVSLIYCFGQAVSCALNVMGFAESMGQVLTISNPWLQKLLAMAVVILLLGINVAGVKWVIRLQFALLIILFLAALDFAVGTFIQYNPEAGVEGYELWILHNNTMPDYLEGQSWFTVCGVFFPAVTGIFAGINMSGDLRNPSKDIPVGTLTSIGTSLFLYLLFILGLGATCDRWALKTDYMIAEKASAIGVMLLCGLYVSSMSACLGALYATPRIIQSMANENVIPIAAILGCGKGPNKVPVYALLLFSAMVLAFVAAGQINSLAPIVTIPFLLTYASIEYAYFSLAMTYSEQKRRVESPTFEVCHPPKVSTTYGSTKPNKGEDLDQLFPERESVKQEEGARQTSSRGRIGSHSTTDSPLTSPDEHSSVKSTESKDSDFLNVSDRSSLLDREAQPWRKITQKSQAWYSLYNNRWIAVIGLIAKVIIMFLVQWAYSLAMILAAIVFWLYIGQVNPGAYRGISEFRLVPWLKRVVLTCLGRRKADYDQIIVTPLPAGVDVLTSQLTEDNEDYSSRERYHHSKHLKPTSTDYQQE